MIRLLFHGFLQLFSQAEKAPMPKSTEETVRNVTDAECWLGGNHFVIYWAWIFGAGLAQVWNPSGVRLNFWAVYRRSPLRCDLRLLSFNPPGWGFQRRLETFDLGRGRSPGTVL